MTGNIQYTTSNKQGRVLAFLRIAVCILLLSLLTAPTCLGHEDPDYDEVPVFLSVPGVGNIEIPAVVYKEAIYLPVTHIFEFLKINSKLSAGLDSVTGFFIHTDAIYLIDNKEHHIQYGGKTFSLQENDIIKTETNLYLRSDYFGLVFGLNCRFNFRSLSVILTTNVDLPVIREMRLDAMRNNVRKLTGEFKADTCIGGKRPLFHFGVADWSVITTQNIKGANNTRLSLGIGAIIAGGETTIALNYDSYLKFAEQQQYYLWRYVNNDNRALRQVMAGKIFTQSAASIFFPVVGVQFTNTPTTYRRSFGSYVLSDRTEPNWTVELYVNNVLVNYTKADASGFFTFEVPLVYGNSAVKLRFYGPYGEERTTERNINIPFNFLPKHQFEYTVSAGMVEDSVHSRFSRANFNYGLGKRLTIGAGMEYLSSVTTGKYMPFINASLRLASNLLVSGEYIYGVRLKQVLSYRLPSNFQLELAYTRYKKGQKAINNTFLEERKAVISYPFRGSKLSLFSRLTFYQAILPAFKQASSSKYTNVEGLLSGVVLGVSANFTTYALFQNSTQPYVYSNFSSTFRLPAKLIFTPQAQYEYNRNRFIAVKGELGKNISSRGFANIFYENNFKSRYQGVGIGFRYDFSFAQVSFSARHGNHTSTMVQAARGSLLYNAATNYVGANNRTSIGKGGIIIIPFVDINGNGIRDLNEPRVFGLKIQSSAGSVKYNSTDTAVVITDLEAYTCFMVRLNTDGIENIAWQVKKKTISITVNPNQLRLLEVPISVINEVAGMVYTNTDKGRKGLGRIIVKFYNKKSKQVGQTLTEEDGSYSYTGLAPGSYTARMDAGQLEKLRLSSSPEKRSFQIKAGKDGEVVDALEFELQPIVPAAQ